MRITPLPHWVLTDKHVAFYDVESKTAIQMVSRLYGKMQELVSDYNNYVDQINNLISDFQNGMIADFEAFKQCVIKTMDDYIETIDTKINVQDTKIAEAVQYMKDNIVATATTLFNQALENGDITATLGVAYDSQSESLTFSIAATTSGGE